MKIQEQILSKLPPDWRGKLQHAITRDSFTSLMEFLEKEYAAGQVFPPPEDVFNAFRLTPFDSLRVVILGQDPYHDDGQAHGLAFSVRPGIAFPPSLRNIFKELCSDTGAFFPDNGTLVSWTEQGVFLLNTVLTVRAHAAASHQKQGWEDFTDEVIRVLNNENKQIIFVLWGASAQKKTTLINRDKHIIMESAHPSPLSAYHGFFGSKPFSKINALLRQNGEPEINWQLEPCDAQLQLQL